MYAPSGSAPDKIIKMYKIVHKSMICQTTKSITVQFSQNYMLDLPVLVPLLMTVKPSLFMLTEDCSALVLPLIFRPI